MNSSLFTSNTVEWETPQALFDQLNEEFRFTLDPCATAENAKCRKYYTKEQDGLLQDWTGETVYCNPPYGRQMGRWIEKCYEHWLSGGGWQLCLFLLGRIPKRFMSTSTVKQRSVSLEAVCGSGMQNAPFPSMIVIYRKEYE